MAEPLLTLDSITVLFKTRRGHVRAVDDVSLSLAPGEVLCLVGESGCGKTTTGKVAAGLLRPTHGQVRFRGREIWQRDKAFFHQFRRAVQLIHQDPYASLNPIRTVFSTLATPLQYHRLVRNQTEAVQRVCELLSLVDLTPPEQFLHKYPHQLSGGQRQRVSIARALTVNPQVIVADEATSMVDVSIRVSILNTLQRLREELGVGFLFITHDLAIAKYFAWHGRIAVMYLGRIVEIGPTPAVINEPLHPYTRALLAAIPEPDPELTRTKPKLLLRSVDAPSLLRVPPGCSFHPRCPWFEAGLCDAHRPSLVPIDGERLVACHVVARERTGAAVETSSVRPDGTAPSVAPETSPEFERG